MPNVLAKHFRQKVKHSTFHPLLHVKIPLPQEGFPPQILRPEATAVFVLRIHRCLGLDEPLDDGNVAVLGCPMQRCDASGAAARGPRSPQAEPNGTEGEKNSEKILAPQKWKFRTLWTLQFLTKVKKHCCFDEMSWGHRVSLKKSCLCYSSQDGLDKLEHAPTLENISAHNWDTSQFENNAESPWPVSLLLVFHVRGRT